MFKIQKCAVYAGIAVAVTVFAGCGFADKNEYTVAGYTSIENCQYEEALQSFELAKEAGEDSQQILRGQGIAYTGLTRYDEAADAFLKALSYSDLRVDDLDYDLNYYLAEAYEKKGDREGARKVYDDILNMNHKDMYALFLRGKIELEEQNYDLALSDFQQAVELEKDGYDLRIEVAGLLSNAGYEEEGISYLTHFLQENEKKLSDYDKGRIFYYMKDYDNAKLSLEMAREEETEQVILLLGKTYEQLGDYNYATSVYKNYLAEHSDAAEIFNQLGLCKLKSGEYAEALSAFKSASNVEYHEMDREVLFNEIVANEYVGNFKQAYILMEQYLKQYPDDETALREFEFLKTR